MKYFRDIVGLAGFAAFAVGVAVKDWAFALIACGVLLMGVAVWGVMRDTRNAARSRQTRRRA